ncbi:MAG: hypothetical protein AAGH89_08620 [Verrucomicrobiota bacterium]
MRTTHKIEDQLPWFQLSFAVVYGILLPLVFCLHQGWNLVFSVPIAAVWLLLNLPVIENWGPRIGKWMLKGGMAGIAMTQQWVSISSRQVREKWQRWRIVGSPATSETS